MSSSLLLLFQEPEVVNPTGGWLDSGLDYLEYGALGLGALFFIITAIQFFFESRRETVRKRVTDFLRFFLIVSLVLFFLGMLFELLSNMTGNPVSKPERKLPEDIVIIDRDGDGYKTSKNWLEPFSLKPEQMKESDRVIEIDGDKVYIKTEEGTYLGQIDRNEIPATPVDPAPEFEFSGTYFNVFNQIIKIYPNARYLNRNTRYFKDNFPFELVASIDPDGATYKFVKEEGGTTTDLTTTRVIQSGDILIFEDGTDRYLSHVRRANNKPEDGSPGWMEFWVVKLGEK